MKRESQLSFFFFVFFLLHMNAQSDSIFSKIKFEADFRFRIEQDWDSRKSDGTFREDRSRLRYRFRTGVSYKKDWYDFGFRIRTGDQRKQQDPQLTLGKGLEEFGTLPIGFEKVYFKGSHKKIYYWFGKYDFSFEKNNELFWSDNVFPEGFFWAYEPNLKFTLVDKISVKASHYILSSRGKSFFDDAYFQGIQTSLQFINRSIKLFPSLYLMRNIPKIPDGGHSYNLDYTIFHVGAKILSFESSKILIDFDFYQNIEDYSDNNSISDTFVHEKTGYSAGIQYGELKKNKDWKFKITYTELQRYAILDYMAQNDWARWDYSLFNSPDGRLSNLKGIEVVAGYMIHHKINLIAKYYNVHQIVPTGTHNETGQRVRFDLNVKI